MARPVGTYRIGGRVGQHLRDRPLHVGLQRRAQLGVGRQAGAVEGVTTKQWRKRLPRSASACVRACRSATRRSGRPRLLRVGGGTAEDLGPVGRQPFEMLGVFPRMGERVVQFRVLQASDVMGGGQGQESRLAASELEECWAHHTSVA